jgi:hypothetical protein
VASLNKKQYENESTKLFAEWKELKHHKNKGFVTDGIVDFGKWNKSKKILVLLKEAYGDKEDWNLSYLIDGDKQWRKNNPLYRTLSMWLYVLNNTTISYIPKNLTDEQLEVADNYLLSSAVINIKKSFGKSSSSANDIYKYSVKDKYFLKKQIELISPQIILCGYTAHPLLKGIYGSDDYSQLYTSTHCIDFDGMTIIDFWHPSRKNGKEEFYSNKLGKDYQKYLKKK